MALSKKHNIKTSSKPHSVIVLGQNFNQKWDLKTWNPAQSSDAHVYFVEAPAKTLKVIDKMMYDTFAKYVRN